MPTRVAGYARVSSAEQANSGVSLDAQQAAITAYCTMRGLELVEMVLDPGVSAGKPLASRDGGKRVLSRISKAEVTGVVAFKLDRVFRDCADCLAVVRDWDQRGVSLHLIDMGGQTVDSGSAMGRFFLTVMAGAAELERNLVGERTKAALGHLRSKGVRLGRDALGWKRSTTRDASDRLTIVEDLAEADTVARIIALRGEGHALRAIANSLASEGHRTKRGGKWYASTVRAVLQRIETDDSGSVAA